MSRAWLLILFLFVPIVSASPVGCEWYNSTVLKCWNNGSIENTTYIRTDGQFANSLDRWGWAYNELGAFYLDRWGNRYTYYLDFSNSELDYVSDNLTYYKAQFSYKRKILTTKIMMNYSFYQDLNDDYVNITFDFDLNPPLGLRFYIFRGFSDIDIENDNDPSYLNYYVGDDWLSRNLSETYGYNEQINSYISIGDLESSRGIYAKLFNNYTLSTDINKVELYRQVTVPIHESFMWIDIDVCTVSIPAGCLYQYLKKDPYPGYGYNVTIDNKYIMRWRLPYVCMSLTGCGLYSMGQECLVFHSTGCYVSTYEKNSTGGYVEIDDSYQYKENFTCFNQTNSECKADAISEGYTKYIELEAHRYTNVTIRGCYKYNNYVTHCTDPLIVSARGIRLSSDYIISTPFDPCIPPRDMDWNITRNLTCDGYDVKVYKDVKIDKNNWLYFSNSNITPVLSNYRWLIYGKFMQNNLLIS